MEQNHYFSSNRTKRQKVFPFLFKLLQYTYPILSNTSQRIAQILILRRGNIFRQNGLILSLNKLLRHQNCVFLPVHQLLISGRQIRYYQNASLRYCTCAMLTSSGGKENSDRLHFYLGVKITVAVLLQLIYHDLPDVCLQAKFYDLN